MRQPSREREFPGMNSINSVLNQQQILSLEEIRNHHGQPQMFPSSNFDVPASSHDDFLEQILSSAASFPWADDPPPPGMVENLEEQSAAVLASKMRQQQISNSAAKTLMLQQQLLLSRALNGTMPHADHNDVVDGPSPNLANDASIKALFNGFTGSLGQPSNQSQHFLHSQGGGLQQSQNFGAPAAPAMSQPAASGSSGGGVAGQPRQRVRARRGQATDPHSIAERLRRERIAERMKALQELVPNANKTDKASMLDEIIDYVKFLQLQVKVLSISRLGGAGTVAPLAADKSPEGRSGNCTQRTSSSKKNEGISTTEQQVAKLMEEDMGSAMQYLQGKGLCLMPVSLATAISTATGHSRTPLPPSINGGEAGGPLSPSMSVLTVQSVTMGGEVTVASKVE